MRGLNIKTKRSRAQLIVCTALALFFTWGSYRLLIGGNRCDMGKNLDGLLLNLLDEFQIAGAKPYIDDGTLLGFYRSGHVINFEFDLDISIAQEDYAKVLKIRDHLLNKYNYYMYTQGDYIFQKAWTLAYTLKWKPYLDEYPCFRVYDQDKWYYADIYCDNRMNKTEMLKLTSFPPDGYDLPENEEKLYLCDYEPARENCHFEETIHPLRTLTALGRELPIPNHPETVLTHVYGSTWQEPRPKGIKMVICHPVGFWVSLFAATALIAWLLLPLRVFLRERPGCRPKFLGP